MFDSNLSILANSQRQSGAGSIPVITTNATNGVRLWSCNPGYENASENGNSNSIVNTFTNAGASYSTISPFFDHSQSLVGPTGSGELVLLANGLYKSGNDVDYNSSFYTSTVKNTLNYSSLSSSKLSTLPSVVNNYRYATFAWTLPANPLAAINFITINLVNTSTLTGDGTSWYTDSGKTRKLFLYYRVEDINNRNNWSTGGTISTPWIDGNRFDNTYTLNGGYSSPQTYPSTTQNVNTPTPMANTIQTGKTLSGLTSAPFGTSASNTSFTVKLPNPISEYNKSSSGMYLYVRIGINMTDTFLFGNPTAIIPATQTIGNGFPSTGVSFTAATAGEIVGTFQINSTFTTPTPTFFTDTNAQFGNVNGVLVGSPNINFNYSYTPVSNSVRYGEVFNTSLVPVTGIPTTITTSSSYFIPQTNTVYPDTIYTVSGVSITNSTGLTTLISGGPFTTSATTGFDITYFSGKNYTSASNLSLPLSTTVSNIYNAKFVSNGNMITTLISTKSGTTLSTTDIGPINVHNSYLTRGSQTTTLVTLSATFTNGTTETTTIGGFGRSASASSGTSSIRINQPVITDLGTSQFSGYYNSASNISVNNTSNFPNAFLLNPNVTPYNLTLTVTYPSSNNGIASGGSTNSNPVVLTYTSPNYYYDGEMIKPTATLSPLTITTLNFTMISGIAVYNNSSNIPLNYALTAANLGINFYNANQTIRYSSNIGSVSQLTETSFSGFSTTNIITYTAPTSYTEQTVTLSVTPYNIVNNPDSIISSSTSADPVSSSTIIIYDPLSITIVNAQYLSTTSLAASSSFTINQNTPIQGCRLWSSATVGSELTLATAAGESSPGSSLLNIVSYAGTSYSALSTPYDNTRDISSTATTYGYEVLLTNGLYTTVSSPYYKSYTSNGTTYNYSNLANNTLNNGYKYITFGWKIGTVSGCKKVIFKISGCASSNVMTSSTGKFVIGSNKLLLYYRVEDASNITDFTKNGAISTVWINGNSMDSNLPLFTSSSFNNTNLNITIYTKNYRGLASNTSCSYDGIDTVTFTEELANPLTNSTNSYYLYCRLGLPSNFSFTNITADIN
jgi:hypothetical protein